MDMVETSAGTNRIGKYELLKKIAEGGMAEIFLARQTGLHQFQKIVAIKKILPHLVNQSQFVQMFLDEARLVARFNHPNIVQVYELGQEDQELFIAMEYVHGENLGTIIRRCSQCDCTIPIEHVVKIGSEVLAGLHYAHSQSNLDGTRLVVHRDISPHNILLSFDGGVKLVDFGVAKARSQISQTTLPGKIKGKYAYMSPEQCMGDRLDGRSDIFSVGIVLYELISWTRLFKRNSELDTLQAVVSGDIQPLGALKPGLDPVLEDIVSRALERDPNRRYQTAQQMQLQLEDFLVSRSLKSNPVILGGFLQDLFGQKLASRRKVLSEMQVESLESALAAGQDKDSSFFGFLDKFFDDRGFEETFEDKKSSESNADDETLKGFSADREETTTKEGVGFGRVLTKKILMRSQKRKSRGPHDPPRPKPPEEFCSGRDLSEVSDSTRKQLVFHHSNLDGDDFLPVRKRFNWFIPVSALVVVGLVVVFVAVFHASDTDMVAPPLGRMLVSSRPAGADVLFDGSRLPAKTPTEIDNVAPRVEHTIRIELPGLPAWEKKIVITDTRRPLEVHADLDKKRSQQADLSGPPIIANAPGEATATLSVNSRPAGALMYLDGLSSGLRTPATLQGVAVGCDHIILLEGKKNRLAFTRISLTDKQTKNLTLNLTDYRLRLPTRIDVRVESQPEGALVEINGFPLKKTPVLVSLLASKASTLRLVLDGYRPVVKQVRPAPGVDLTLYFQLQKK